MLGIGGIEILDASYSLGMCGHIVLEVNETGKQYRVNHSMSDGWQVSERASESEEWSRPRRMQADEFIFLLPKDRGMTYSVFIAMWAGFASGFEKGVKTEQSRWWELERRRKSNSAASESVVQ